jgi:hypothetical protein
VLRLVAAAFLLAGCGCGDDDGPEPLPCPEGCPRGESCVRGVCLPPVPCEILTCRPGDGCDNGVCVPADLCLDVVCGEGEACQKGTCVPAYQDRDFDSHLAFDDCDDGDPTSYPGGDEVCDAVDNDCDGAADEVGCALGEVCCAAAGWGCTDVRHDVDNCGRCGRRCPEGEVCCDGSCSDPLTDPQNCGACGRPCVTVGCLEAVCEGGVCAVTPDDCDDRRQCTDDRCDPVLGECQHFPDTERCGAQQECLADQGCVASPGCDAGCGDGFACTEDSCDDTRERCVHEPLDSVCDDGDLCTIDMCAVGLGCLYDPIPCEDGDACTIDRCDPVLGCVADRPVEDCWNGLDDDCDGLVDCGNDPDCDGLVRPLSGGAFACTCRTAPLGACGPDEPCASCVFGAEGPRVCLKVDGGWEWTEPGDPRDLAACDRACSVRCACDSNELFRCDGQRYVRVLEGDDTCDVEASDRCD